MIGLIQRPLFEYVCETLALITSTYSFNQNFENYPRIFPFRTRPNNQMTAPLFRDGKTVKGSLEWRFFREVVRNIILVSHRRPRRKTSKLQFN